MYLGMTEEDYQNVQNETPKLVAKRLGIQADVSGDELDTAIKSKDEVAFLILSEFRTIYKKWWDKSKEFSPDSQPDKAEELQCLMNSRNEIRTSLVSYLNGKYGKRHEPG
jgi:hypothetical protein